MTNWHELLDPIAPHAVPEWLDAVGAERVRPVYLASPFTQLARLPEDAPSATGMLRASDRAGLWLGRLADEGVTAISPVVISVSMIMAGCRLPPFDHHAWMQWCKPLMNAAPAILVAPVDGWRESEGIRAEVTWAWHWGVPVRLLAEAA